MSNNINARDVLQIVQERFHNDEYFLEINFNTSPVSDIWDEELKKHVITADCDLGTVIIVFDQWGRLDKLEIC